ncbi:MAG: YbfB/YjiJ family MFS transporter [Pseudomonadota bacterium]
MTEGRTYWRGVVSALCAVLIGIGLARFGYTPLIPALIAEGWFSPSDAAYLGAANLAGYLVGALATKRLLGFGTATGLLRTMMALAVASFFACALPWGFTWYFVWRFMSGCAGGTLMALAAPTAMLSVPDDRRGIAGGAIFTGVGLGIALSGTLVPLLLTYGLAVTWVGLGLLSLALAVIAWFGWGAARSAPSRQAAAPDRGISVGWPLVAIFVAYAFDAAGIVPHTVFIVDFVARGLDRGLASGASYWVLLGAGALVGALIAGWFADRAGFAAATRVALALQALAVLLPAVTTAPVALGVSCVILGAFVPGIVPLVLGRVQEMLPGDRGAQRTAWGHATAAFALGQAVAGYGFSWLFEQSGYAYLFWLGAAAMLLGLVVDGAVSLAKTHGRRFSG